MAQNSSGTLRERYAYKLSYNAVGFIANIFMQAMIPKALGPKAYGNFNFLTGIFTEITNFLDMGSSSCFYTKLSKRQKDWGLIAFYMRFVGIAALVVAGFVSVAFVSGSSAFVWPDQTFIFIMMAAVLSIFTKFSQTYFLMADALGLTIPAEKIKVAQKIFGLLLICALYFTGLLNLMNFFLYNYIILVFFWLFLRGSW
jgi:hypothetical protein